MAIQACGDQGVGAQYEAEATSAAAEIPTKATSVITESELKRQREARNEGATSKSTYKQSGDDYAYEGAFDADTFREDLTAHFESHHLPMTTDDAEDLGIIGSGARAQFNDSDTAYQDNNKFTRFASNIYKGYHKDHDPYERILAVGMKLYDVDAEGEKQLKVYQDGHTNKVYDSSEYLSWDVQEVLNFQSTSENVLAYASTEYPSNVPNALQVGKNSTGEYQTVQDILKINDNKWTTIDINEAWSKADTRSNTYSLGVELGFEIKVGFGSVSPTFTFGYERTRAIEETEGYQVNSEIAFFAPNQPIPPGYSFRLHPVMGYGKTTGT